MATLAPETQVAILSTVMNGVLLDLERARMEREDFRQGKGPCTALNMGFTNPNFTTKQILRSCKSEIECLHQRLEVYMQESEDEEEFAHTFLLGDPVSMQVAGENGVGTVNGVVTQEPQVGTSSFYMVQWDSRTSNLAHKSRLYHRTA